MYNKRSINPSDFEMADKEMVLESNRIFARKFSDKHRDIVDLFVRLLNKYILSSFVLVMLFLEFHNIINNLI